MSFKPALAPGARRWWPAALAAVCLGIGAGAYAIANRSGATSVASQQIATESVAGFQEAVSGMLRSEHLDYHWVDCVTTAHRFHGVPVVRCNVDFGEPHIVAYCSVLRGGRLETSEDDPAIPCGHDDAGFSDPVVTYG